MARIRTGTGLTPDAFRPQAAPVDRTRRTVAGQKLAGLAQGLSGFAPHLLKLSELVHEKESAEQAAAGEKAAREAALDAQKRGEIPASGNPYFRKHYKRQAGRMGGLKYASDLQLALASNPELQNSTDLGAFDSFEADYRRKWIAENVAQETQGLDFESGWGPQVDGIVANARSNFARKAGENMERQVGENFYAEVHDTLQQFGKEYSPQALGDYLNILATEAVENGLDARTVNRRTLEALISAAKETANEELLEAAKHIKAGNHGLDDRPEYATKIAAARLEIAHEVVWRDNKEYQRQEREQKEAREAVTTDFIAALEENPQTDPRKFVARLQAFPGGALGVERLYALQDAYENRLYEGDPGATQEAFLRLHGMGRSRQGFLTKNAAAELFATRQITLPVFQTLMSGIAQRDAQGSQGSLLDDGVLKTGLRAISRQLGAGDLNPLAGPANERLAQDAQDEFRILYIQAMQPGGELVGAAEAQKVIWVNQHSQQVVSSRLRGTELGRVAAIPGSFLPAQSPTEFQTRALVPKPTLEHIQSEIDDIRVGKRNMYSAEVARIFHRMRIPVEVARNLDAADQMVKIQLRLLEEQEGLRLDGGPRR